MKTKSTSTVGRFALSFLMVCSIFGFAFRATWAETAAAINGGGGILGGPPGAEDGSVMDEVAHG